MDSGSETEGRSRKKDEFPEEEELAGLLEDKLELLTATIDSIQEYVPKVNKDIKKSISRPVPKPNNRQMGEIREIIKAQIAKIDITQKEQKRPTSYAGLTAATGSYIRVAGMKKPIATESTFKAQLSLGDDKVPGEELNKITMMKLKPKEAGSKPNPIYAIRDNKVIIESSEDCFDKIKNSLTIKQMKIKMKSLGKF
ncbi:hypothetical protein HUJ04_010851 [Dendroctonus ponderosae]|nr:hypothetical protein HUJ04_010851 [Dendroctonus ponderosae]